MKQTKLWAFVLMFMVAYTGVLFLLSVLLGFLLKETLFIIVEKPFMSAVIGTIIGFVACTLTATGLRSYFYYPASIAKITHVLIAIQFTLNLLALIIEKNISLHIVTTILITTIISWGVVYSALTVAEKYLLKKE